MTGILLAMTWCLNVDGVPVEPITLTDPLTVSADAAGQTVRPSRWDSRTVAMVLRSRGFSERQIRAALRDLRLVEPTTEALRCGECTTGGFDPRSYTCIAGLKRSPCTACTICSDPLPEPIAYGAPPAGVRIVR
jgi:hypothetical protein